MSPYEKIEAKYAATPQRNSFSWYVDWHHRHGFVFSGPDFFIMGRPVVKAAAPGIITEPTALFSKEVCDCWFIHAMAGDMAKAWSIVPWELPWLAWERALGGGLELRFYQANRIKQLSSPNT